MLHELGSVGCYAPPLHEKRFMAPIQKVFQYALPLHGSSFCGSVLGRKGAHRSVACAEPSPCTTSAHIWRAISSVVVPHDKCFRRRLWLCPNRRCVARLPKYDDGYMNGWQWWVVSGRVVGVVCCAAMGRGSEIGFCGWVGCDEWGVFGNGLICTCS